MGWGGAALKGNRTETASRVGPGPGEAAVSFFGPPACPAGPRRHACQRHPISPSAANPSSTHTPRAVRAVRSRCVQWTQHPAGCGVDYGPARVPVTRPRRRGPLQGPRGLALPFPLVRGPFHSAGRVSRGLRRDGRDGRDGRDPAPLQLQGRDTSPSAARSAVDRLAPRCSAGWLGPAARNRHGEGG